MTNGSAMEDEDDEKSLGSLFGDDDEENGDDLFGDAAYAADIANGTSPGDNTVGSKQNEDKKQQDEAPPPPPPPTTNQISDSVFLSSCIDGTVDIWDRRQENKIAHLSVTSGVPPWAMSVSSIMSYFGISELTFSRLAGPMMAIQSMLVVVTARLKNLTSNQVY